MSNEVVLKVEYIVDRDDMTDDEYQAQEELHLKEINNHLSPTHFLRFRG